MYKKIFLFVVIALIAIALVACGGGSSGSSSSSASGANVTITMTEFKFDPMNVTVAPGQTVNLTLINKGSIEHTWVVVGTQIKFTVAAGKTETKSFTAPAAGTYVIDCDIPGHKEAGMVGQLIVK
jgi:plastocyanin